MVRSAGGHDEWVLRAPALVRRGRPLRQREPGELTTAEDERERSESTAIESIPTQPMRGRRRGAEVTQPRRLLALPPTPFTAPTGQGRGVDSGSVGTFSPCAASCQRARLESARRRARWATTTPGPRPVVARSTGWGSSARGCTSGSRRTQFWEYAYAIFQGLFWPAYMVFQAFEALEPSLTSSAAYGQVPRRGGRSPRSVALGAEDRGLAAPQHRGAAASSVRPASGGAGHPGRWRSASSSTLLASPEHLMIEARGLTKRYGVKLAVDDLTFTVRPGVVTGFLGPNGAGKSTTMRMMVGLDRPTAGSVRVNGTAPTPSTPPRCTRSGRCSRPGRSTPDVRRATTCGRWPSPAASAAPGSTRSSSWSGSPTSPTSGWARSRSGWASGSASRRRSSGTRRPWCSTSRSTASTWTASGGSARC